jgi:hypothetical protein
MSKEKSKLVTGYKAFKSDFTCYKDHKYEVGKTYQHKGKVELCQSGFHFCVFPLAVLGYYDLIGTRFAEVESDDVRGDDGDKSVAGNITIKKEITFADMIKAQISLVFSFCFTKEGKPAADSKETVSSERNAKLASSGYGAQLASSGDGAQLASSGYGAKLASSGDGAKLASSGYGAKLASSGYGAKLASSGDGAQLASSGDGAKLASSGDGAKLASSGYGAQLASSGYGAQLASSGDGAKLASSGDGAKLASSGYGAKLASSGDGAKLASSGYGAKLEATGKDSAVAGIGYENCASGAVGSWITLAEWEYLGCGKYKLLCVKTEQVDGKRIKAAVLYKLVKGEFVAA